MTSYVSAPAVFTSWQRGEPKRFVAFAQLVLIGWRLDGESDAFLIKTSKDLLQTKIAVNCCKQAVLSRDIWPPNPVQVTVETTGHADGL